MDEMTKTWMLMLHIFIKNLLNKYTCVSENELATFIQVEFLYQSQSSLVFDIPKLSH